MTTPVIIALIALGAISFITFCLYGADKSKAKRHAWRIPEKTLLLCSFLGGAIGGSLAMSLFRHKTKHWYFVAVNAIGLVWQIAAVAAIYIFL